MRAENYIAFFTVCGFFVGLVFTIINAKDPIEMMIYTILMTFFFYIIIHIIIMNYVDVKGTLKQFFDKQKHEDVSEYLMGELAIKEKRMENLVLKVVKIKQGVAEKNARKPKAA